MEYPPEPVDLDWLASLEAGFEAQYQAVKAEHDGRKERQERALREELKEQEQSQPSLGRRFAKQEAEREKREKQLREERARDKLEQEIALTSHEIGFHFERSI
jgi:hypothetical protein